MNLFPKPYRGATSASAEAFERNWLTYEYSTMTDASLENVIISAQQYGEFDSIYLQLALAEKERREHAAVDA